MVEIGTNELDEAFNWLGGMRREEVEDFSWVDCIKSSHVRLALQSSFHILENIKMTFEKFGMIPTRLKTINFQKL